MNYPLYVEIAKAAVPLVAVAIGAWLAPRLYFRQKEYELARQRYLEEGVDVIAAEVETMFGVVSHNFARALALCKSFRDTRQHFEVEELGRGFLPLDQSKFHQIAHHRVGALIGSTAVWQVYQHAMADAQSANSQIAVEIPEAIRIVAANPDLCNDIDDAIEQMFDQIKESHRSCFKYAELSNELHALGLLLEPEKLSFQQLAIFRSRPEVVALVSRLRAKFELADEKELSA